MGKGEYKWVVIDLAQVVAVNAVQEDAPLSHIVFHVVGVWKNDLLLSSMCVLYELEGNLPSALGFTPTYSRLIVWISIIHVGLIHQHSQRIPFHRPDGERAHLSSAPDLLPQSSII